MEAKFDKDGNLLVKRAGKWKEQRCHRGQRVCCSDECGCLVEFCDTTLGLACGDSIAFTLVEDHRNDGNGECG